MKAVIVTGGRNYADGLAVQNALGDIRPQLVIQGGANGADELARDWAESYADLSWTVPALWDEQSKPAGHIRNQVMCDIGKALERGGRSVTVLAFPGGNGTASIVEKAHACGLKVRHAVTLDDGGPKDA